MNSVSEALNTLISAANVAHSKGVYSLEESHYIYLAISYLNSLQQEAPAEAPVEETVVEAPVMDEGSAPMGDSPQGY